eukprot:GHVL01012328.1.p1 GENE.GHVL01012328.1~~GHVL01012328.1.p1  ORF type:complete len:464 (+),score=105.83 GHVL01012328.1:29-1420(+)
MGTSLSTKIIGGNQTINKIIGGNQTSDDSDFQRLLNFELISCHHLLVCTNAAFYRYEKLKQKKRTCMFEADAARAGYVDCPSLSRLSAVISWLEFLQDHRIADEKIENDLNPYVTDVIISNTSVTQNNFMNDISKTSDTPNYDRTIYRVERSMGGVYFGLDHHVFDPSGVDSRDVTSEELLLNEVWDRIRSGRLEQAINLCHEIGGIQWEIYLRGGHYFCKSESAIEDEENIEEDIYHDDPLGYSDTIGEDSRCISSYLDSATHYNGEGNINRIIAKKQIIKMLTNVGLTNISSARKYILGYISATRDSFNTQDWAEKLWFSLHVLREDLVEALLIYYRSQLPYQIFDGETYLLTKDRKAVFPPISNQQLRIWLSKTDDDKLPLLDQIIYDEIQNEIAICCGDLSGLSSGVVPMGVPGGGVPGGSKLCGSPFTSLQISVILSMRIFLCSFTKWSLGYSKFSFV